jgi:hypothetical protein
VFAILLLLIIGNKIYEFVCLALTFNVKQLSFEFERDARTHTIAHTHTHTHRNNLINLHFCFKKGKWANKNIIYGLILISTSIPLYYFQDILITFPSGTTKAVSGEKSN